MNRRVQPGSVGFVSRHEERWFHQPVEIVQADSVDDVRPCLNRIAAAIDNGLHAAGFIAYEAAPAFDPAFVCPDIRSNAQNRAPLLWFGLYTDCRRSPLEPCSDAPPFTVGDWKSPVPEHAFRQAIARIREWIAAGDSYQVNYSFPMTASFQGDPYAWFRQLTHSQAADHCAYVHTGRFHIVSTSPELFFRLDGHHLETRPMKGTRPRGLWPDADRRIAAELAHAEKDRAENVMIVDLLRNDMGRVSEAGTVQVRRLFEVERYETVWQMTSNIFSWTAAPVEDILAALFPSGSVTGAPKIRTMQIIREIEPFPRGVYCGAVGWWSPGRQAEFNVAIRTATVDAEAGRAEYHVGSGITWGSEAGNEYDECRMKARILTCQRPAFELLESIRFDGDYFLLPEHLARLGASADYFGFVFPLDALHKALGDEAARLAARGAGPWKVRLTLARGGLFQITSGPAMPSTPVRLGLAAEPIDESDVFLYHKTTHRAAYERARASRPDCDDVVLWNRRGELTESTVANLVLEIDGQRLTPAVSCGLLGGILRAHLLDTGVLREGVLTKDDLARAQSIRLINSVRKEYGAQWVSAL